MSDTMNDETVPADVRVAARHPRARVLPLLLMGAMAGGADAWAVSGEPENTAGIHSVPAAACQTLRSVSQTQGDLYVICNANRAAAAEGAEPCDLLFADTLVRGDTFGFCADSFANRQVRGEAADLPLVEAGKEVRGTIFGANIGLVGSEGAADVFCTTFSGSDEIGADVTQGSRVCVEISKNVATKPASCGALPIRYDDTAGCTTIENALKATLTGGQDPIFSHALFLDVLPKTSSTVTLGDPGSQALFVCQGYRAKCVDDEAGATAINSTYPYGFFETPGCGMTRSGYRCW